MKKLQQWQYSILIFFVLNAFFIGFLSYLYYHRLQTEIEIKSVYETEMLSEMKDQGIDTMREVISNILLIKEIIELEDPLDIANDSYFTSDEQREHIEEYMFSWIKANEGYFQTRILSLNGMELIRVQHYGEILSVVPQIELQDKSDRYYYTESVNLENYDLYISDLDLNIEDGEIEIVDGHTIPTIRFVTPLYEDLTKIGYIVVNFYASTLIGVDNHILSDEKLFILNKDQYFLNSNVEEIIPFGFMYDEFQDETLSKYFDIDISDATTGEIKSINDSGTLYFYTKTDLEEIESVINSSSISNQVNLTFNDINYYFFIEVNINHSNVMTSYQDSLVIFYSIGFVVIVFISIIINMSVTNNKKYMEAMIYKTEHDMLTGLNNNPYILNKMNQLISENKPFTLIYMDLDNFKDINDQYGHLIGDKALIESGKRILSCTKSGDVVSRMGGDEFAILLTSEHTKEDLEIIINNIRQLFMAYFHLDEYIHLMDISLGVSKSNGNKTANQILKEADDNMYKNKQAHKKVLA